MIAFFDKLFEGLTDPYVLFGHFTYFLLIVSMLMRRMVWLRSLAVASGITKVIYRAFFVLDPVSVLWESIFVLVNVAQLIVIWYYEHHHSFKDEEQHFASSIPAGIDRSSVKRFLELSDLVRIPEGGTLTVEGDHVDKLLYIADGVVKVERGGRIVAVCGPGDYVGELSFLSGAPASATVTAVKPVRALSFMQEKLRAATTVDAELRRVLESALNKNLAGKLVRANDPSSTAFEMGV